MTPQIRILNEGDAGELFRLRHGALLDSPLAFFGLPRRRQRRRQGVGMRLLDAAILYARSLDGAASVHLSVSESAAAANQLYESAGFETWGVEPDAVRFEGKSASERHMRLSLGPGHVQL